MSDQYITTRVLTRSQFIPIYIPSSPSIRVFKKIHGDSWYELDRVDLMEGSSPDTYSYDDKLVALLFNPILIGNEIQIQYEHDGVPNPGVVDLVPTILGEQAYYNYNSIISGLYGIDSYIEGNVHCGSKTSYILDGGIVRIDGLLYSVGNTYWDLNKFGAQSGKDIVTSLLFYLYKPTISDTQLKTKFIQTPNILRTAQYNLADGRGISSSMTELNNAIQTIFSNNDGESSFIEIVRLTVVSKKAPYSPDVYSYYESKYRVLPTI